MKKTISFILCIIMIVSLLSVTAFAEAGLTNFQKTLTYSNGKYSDVASSDWFNTSVKAAYEYGLMAGQSSNSFGANSNVKLSEVIAMATRLNSIYQTGSAKFTEGTPWYQTYVDYAITNGIIAKGRFENYEVYATRYQVAEIFAASLPSSTLSVINTIDIGAIPDVSLESPYDCIYLLYRAGVLTGKTTAGEFCPSEKVLRCEMAAIVTRMADTNLRVKFTIAPASSGTVEVDDITNKTELLSAVNKGREYASLASDYITAAYTAALASDAATAIAGLSKALDSITAAAKYAQSAAAFCKANPAYSSAYDKLYNSYLAGLDATSQIKTIASAPLASSYSSAKTLISGVGEAMSTAATTISAISG